MDSGFDLYCPEDVVFDYDSSFQKQHVRTISRFGYKSGGLRSA